MAKRRVKKIDVFQTSLISAIVLFFVSLILIIPMGLFMGVAGGFSDIPGFAFSGVAFIIFAPFLYGVMGFISTAIWCAIYNRVAKRFGGIEMEIEIVENQEDQVQSAKSYYSK